MSAKVLDFEEYKRRKDRERTQAAVDALVRHAENLPWNRPGRPDDHDNPKRPA